MAYANIHKNGDLKQKEQLSALEFGAERNYHSKSIANNFAREVAAGLFHSTADMFQCIGKTASDFFEILMEPVYHPGLNINPVEEAEKRRRKKLKGQNQDQGQGLSR